MFAIPNPAERWRRSLRFRVVASTLLISLTTVTVIGLLVLDQVARGLLRSQRASATAEVESGLRYAQAALADVGTDRSEESVRLRLEELTQQLAGRGGQAGAFDVVLLDARRDQGSVSGREAELSDVPADLRAVVGEEAVLARTYTSVARDGRNVPALVMGAPVAAPTGPYELYFVFPLQTEAETLSLVRRTLLGGGVGLLLVVVAVAALVTRQVVTPVRLAARTAERLAAGRLESRLDVHGEHEVARLGEAFNKMAASLQQKIGQLQELSRLQQRFVSDVSHELRTPLTTVRMAADVLHAARTDFPPEIARSAELLAAELDRFEALLVDLLEISRFDAGAAVLDTELVSITELVYRVVDALAPLAARRGSEIIVHAPPAGLGLAEVDPRRVERIVRNLVANAVEHGEGLPIEIAVGADDDAVAIVVRDYGVGLKPGEASRVFSRFWRADPARARHTAGGTGLGLAIAFEDARLHGGWLQAWGTHGQGAAFRLTLPRTAAGELDHSPLPLEPEAVASG